MLWRLWELLWHPSGNGLLVFVAVLLIAMYLVGKYTNRNFPRGGGPL